MIFTHMQLTGALIIEPDRIEDGRGFFARAWCKREFLAHGLNPDMAQCNISFNRHKGTLRGMHYQAAPCMEAKLVRCTMGSLFDVIVDIRPESPTFRKWAGVELSAENRCMLYIPEGFAHGFITIEDSTEVFYQMSEFYSPDFAKGIRWNDPAFKIEWPINPRVLSERDASFPDFAI